MFNSRCFFFLITAPMLVYIIIVTSEDGLILALINFQIQFGLCSIICGIFIKICHLYLFSAFNNTDCVNAALQYQIGK